MTSATMARKRVSYRIDERIISALKKQAQSEGRNMNNWIEINLMYLLKEKGSLDKDFSPLGETRGGDHAAAESSKND